MHTYLVSFYFRKKGEKTVFLGSVDVDDVGLSQHFTLMTKAFRQAGPKCLIANYIKTERK